MIELPDGGADMTAVQRQSMVETIRNDQANVTTAAADIKAGAGTATDQLTVMDGSASNLVTAAGTGFKLDPQAAATLIKGCKDALVELENANRAAQAIDVPPKLGTLSGAKTVSQFTQKVATDDQGITPAVQSLQATIVQMMDAYQKASTNYQQTEQMVADMVKQQAAGLGGSGTTPSNGPTTFHA